MLVYRDSFFERPSRQWLQQLAWRARGGDVSVESCRDCCVEFGELEAAIVDALCPELDGCTPLTRSLRRTGGYLAGSFVAAFDGDAGRAVYWRRRAEQALDELLHMQLPSRIHAKTPEGFAYYGLYPEQYVRAAELAYQQCKPERAVVVGLRSIGTTLASVVEASLGRRACRTSSYVVRPRGEPFARTLSLQPELQAELRTKTDAYFLIVDEGPGLSGSSLTGVALGLRQLGIERSRIVLLPSYRTDGTQFVNESARQVWGEHAQFVGEFEPGWLASVTDGAELCELSAGRWVSALGAEAEHIACHPQHERRKYLARGPGGRTSMLRFCGLGSHGQRVRARALALEGSGVTPKVVGSGAGMLALEHVPARISATRSASDGFIPAVVAYLAYRRRHLEAGEPAPLEQLAEMTQRNISESCGPAACEALSRLVARASASSRHATVTDGRMLPHEWLATSNGFRKVDAFDHGDDHFYPGPCDIAWDLAGACVEFALTVSERSSLLSLYAEQTGDTRVGERLPFFELSYLAYRMAYARGAAQSLATIEAGARFAKLERRYHRALQTRLAAGR